MRTLLLGATLVTAFLLTATSASAQCCGGAVPAMDHSAHAAPATPTTPATPATGCCDTHAMAAPAQGATPMACCDHHATPVPDDDPAVALAGLGLLDPPAVTVIEAVFPFGGRTAAPGIPIR